MKYILSLIFPFIFCSAFAQTELLTSTALYSLEKQIDADTSEQTAASIFTSFSASETDGDFLVYKGRSGNKAALEGIAIKDYGKYGILSGRAYYAKGLDRDISWNAMRFPDFYMPYIITDSTGGDSRFEIYCAESGYAKNINKWHLGFDFKFFGEQAYRLTDPRVLNNTTFLTFKLSVGKTFKNQSGVLATFYYMRNKQYEHDRYWRPGEQQRFFVLYGFGLYDMKESVVSFGVSRMYYINNFGSELFYILSKSGRLNATIGFTYDYKKMYTEESDILKLYNTCTHNLLPKVDIKYAFTKKFDVKLQSISDILMRKGYENIYEKYVTDVATSTYDFRKIADEQNYIFNLIDSKNTLRFEYNNDKINIGVETSASVFYRLEKNTKYCYKVKNINFLPAVKTDISFDSKNHKENIYFGVEYQKQKSLKNTYDVEIKNNAIPHLDFQTCFAPYAYYSAEFNKISCQISYKHRFEKYSVGIKFSGIIIDGNRLPEVEYTKEIGYNSICPMISTHADKHNEKIFSTALFVTF